MFRFIFNSKLIAIVLFSTWVLTSCNKDPEAISENPIVPVTGTTVSDTLASRPGDSLFVRLLIKAGMIESLKDQSLSQTVFVPGNQAIKTFLSIYASNFGITLPAQAPDSVFSVFITNAVPSDVAKSVLQYHILPQKLMSANFTDAFPNLQYPSLFNPAPQISSFFRLSNFVSSSNGFYLNNVPLLNKDIMASNGVIHELAAVNFPPSKFLWNRIDEDTSLTLLKELLLRADSGSALFAPALNNPGANFTVFAPENLAVKKAINFLSQGLISVASPDSVFVQFIRSNLVTTRLIAGLLSYHIFDGRSVSNPPVISTPRPGRAFLNNFPATATFYKTLLNADTSLRNHPGIQLSVNMVGPIAGAASVKGLVNPTAANVIIQPSPLNNATSNQHCVNGVLHKIDQVLLPFLP
jgi:uncharacterized surface protein with fasciclin (FAS1) repeats